MSSNRQETATLRDVARKAGVSTATASRVVTGSARVRVETRERVERAIRELLYVPPGSVRTGAIGLLVPELANPIFPALAQAMERQATKAGLATILCNIRGSTVAEADYMQMLLERRVAGMIFISSEAADLRADHGHYARLVGQGARIVFVNGAVETLDVPHVGVDERAAGQIATQHLLELGHRRIGFVAGPSRFRRLPAQVEIALATGDLETARTAATELGEIADMYMIDGKRTPSLAIAWYMPVICSRVIERPWPIGRLENVLPDHWSIGGTSPALSPGSPTPVRWPRPNFCSISA